MSIYEFPIESVYESIQRGDMVALSDNLDQLYDSGKRSAEAKSALVFGYKVLARTVGTEDPVLTLNCLDRARQMFRSDRGLLQSVVYFLEEFLYKNEDELTARDIDLFEKILQAIVAKIPESSLEMAKKEMYNISYTVHKLRRAGNFKKTSSLYMISEPMMYNLYADLSDQERENRLFDIIEKTILEMDRMEKENSAKKENDEVNPSGQS